MSQFKNLLINSTSEIIIFGTLVLVTLITATIGFLFWKKLQDTNNLKNEFISIASHKLRTPLTYIRWEVANITESAKGNLSVKTETSLERINDASKELLKISDVLLEVSNKEKGIVDYKFHKSDIKKRLKHASEDFKGLIKRKKIDLSLDIDKDLPLIKVDIEKIDFVIRVFIENAVTYTPNSGKISISLRKKNKKGLIFSITDNGIGLTKNERNKMFTKFFRSRNALLVDVNGFGIGLFLAKGIIKQHKGNIGVSSKGLGKGSTFWFTIPYI